MADVSVDSMVVFVESGIKDYDGFGDVHGGRGFGVRNKEGERVLEFALANDLVVGNTWFVKRESHLVTHCSRNLKTQIDYILYPKRYRRAITDVKVIPIEDCVQQHNLLVCDITIFIPKVNKRKSTPRIRTLKLRDKAVADKFRDAFTEKVVTGDVDLANTVEELAKQMDRTNQDVVGEKCVRNDAGELSLSDDEKMKAWVEHYSKLLNVEFEWPSELLPEVAPVEGHPPLVTVEQIRKALCKVKCGKAAGPSGVIAEMLKAAGEEGTEMLTEVVFSNGVIPKDWVESHILNLYKGK
ncbi:uncharacterized protein LOC127872585 [Dreissena polymorpha]|uniref:uncharacterized protein LOC127872585 n=1 Tax=Dreissena polymorpha TaxID=45954 RepID=UPI0022655F6E|nr:uncharacterized protein LOC127872585 [Dreissena polymorpha]